MSDKKQATAEYRPCAHCGKLISPGRGRRRKFCSLACKQKAYNRRKKAGLLR